VWFLWLSEPPRLTLAASTIDCQSKPSSCVYEPFQSVENYGGQGEVDDYTRGIFTDFSNISGHPQTDFFLNRGTSRGEYSNRFSGLPDSGGFTVDKMETFTYSQNEDDLRFAVIGDYGTGSENEALVATPNALTTTG
jgi:hypothetical protein